MKSPQIDEQLDEILEYEPHREGLHSDDRGGSSDNKCWCTVKSELKQLIKDQEIKAIKGVEVPDENNLLDIIWRNYDGATDARKSAQAIIDQFNQSKQRAIEAIKEK